MFVFVLFSVGFFYDKKHAFFVSKAENSCKCYDIKFETQKHSLSVATKSKWRTIKTETTLCGRKIEIEEINSDFSRIGKLQKCLAGQETAAGRERVN